MIKSPVFLAVVLLLITLAAVGYQAYQLNKVRLGEVNVASERSEVDTERLSTDHKIPSLAQLAVENLMGNPQKAVEKPLENVISIASLKLTLIGTITKAESSKSSAIIQKANRETKRYFVGDMIESGVVLTAVSVDSVVLTGQSQSEMLRYPKDGSASAAVSPAPAAVAPIYIPLPASESSSAPVEPTAESTEPPPMPENPKMATLRERFKRAQIIRDAQNKPAQQKAE